MTNHPRWQNENLKWVVSNLPALLVILLLLKDFRAIAYLSRRVDNLEAAFISRLVMYPFNASFAAFAGWAVPRILRRRGHSW